MTPRDTNFSNTPLLEEEERRVLQYFGKRR